MAAPAKVLRPWNGLTGSVTGTALNSPYSLGAELGVLSFSCAAGTAVAVIDSGIANVPDFTGRIVVSRDFMRGQANGVNVATPVDPYGHGTHIAGLVASALSPVRGVATGCNLVSLRVLDGTGAGNTSDVIQALQWITDNSARYGVSVLNMSLGPAHTRHESESAVFLSLRRDMDARWLDLDYAACPLSPVRTRRAAHIHGLSPPSHDADHVGRGAAHVHGTGHCRMAAWRLRRQRGLARCDGARRPSTARRRIVSVSASSPRRRRY